ncbi:uncharacterized protein PAC_17338 [Phialocephala subalpina]|uniref:Transmembrane protein n=1 Tax=Phialocephala subalpina TaxID=576137 RepID=A0A1L7XR07_9HELO|nr:uncharacterized protein PAC_17338 [Phialocephala subalpina]
MHDQFLIGFFFYAVLISLSLADLSTLVTTSSRSISSLFSTFGDEFRGSHVLRTLVQHSATSFLSTGKASSSSGVKHDAAVFGWSGIGAIAIAAIVGGWFLWKSFRNLAGERKLMNQEWYENEEIDI